MEIDGTFTHVGGEVNVGNEEDSLAVLQKVGQRTIPGPSNATPRCTHIHTKTCTWIFTATLLIMGKNEKDPSFHGLIHVRWNITQPYRGAKSPYTPPCDRTLKLCSVKEGAHTAHILPSHFYDVLGIGPVARKGE